MASEVSHSTPSATDTSRYAPSPGRGPSGQGGRDGQRRLHPARRRVSHRGPRQRRRTADSRRAHGQEPAHGQIVDVVPGPLRGRARPGRSRSSSSTRPPGSAPRPPCTPRPAGPPRRAGSSRPPRLPKTPGQERLAPLRSFRSTSTRRMPRWPNTRSTGHNRCGIGGRNRSDLHDQRAVVGQQTACNAPPARPSRSRAP